MKVAGIILFIIGGVVFIVGLMSSIADGSISEMFSHFGEGRGAVETVWWLVIATFLFIVGTLLLKNARPRK